MMTRRAHWGGLIIGAIAAVACGRTPVAGDIHGFAFSKDRSPYVVEKEIVVPGGKTVRIPSGCVLLFSPFTGLRVEGRLIVEGSQDEPVVFTSIHDTTYNPESTQLANPFDWNGIYITKASARSFLNNFELMFSVYGIKSESENIVIQNGIFRQNGQFHFTIDDKIQYVQDNIPFSSGTKKAEKAGKEGDAAPAPAKRRGETSRGTRLVRFTCLGVGIAGVGVGTILAVRTGNLHSDLTTVKVAEGNQDRWNADHESWKRSRAGSVVSFGIGLLGAVGFGVTFFF
jgi:hypothetical protein